MTLLRSLFKIRQFQVPLSEAWHAFVWLGRSIRLFGANLDIPIDPLSPVELDISFCNYQTLISSQLFAVMIKVDCVPKAPRTDIFRALSFFACYSLLLSPKLRTERPMIEHDQSAYECVSFCRWRRSCEISSSSCSCTQSFWPSSECT